MRERLGVDTTPQTFIDGELVGTLDDLREYLGEDVPDDSKTYRPVVTLFAVTFLMAFGGRRSSRNSRIRDFYSGAGSSGAAPS